MAEDTAQAKLDKEQRKFLEDLLAQSGLGAGYIHLINLAVINDWSPQQFITAVAGTEQFHQKFPGLVDQSGDLNAFLTNGQTGLSATNLGTAIRNYNTLQQSYEKAAHWDQVSREQMQYLIKNEVSPDEFGRRVAAIKQFRAHPQAHSIFNQQLKQAGLPEIDKQNWFKFLAGTADETFYNVYEASQLRLAAPGLFNKQEAKSVAAALGGSGVDTGGNVQVATEQQIGQLIQQVRSNLRDIGPELKKSGVSRLDLTRWLANPSNDPHDIAGKAAAAVAARRGLGRAPYGQQLQRGVGGGLVRSGQDKPVSYG